MRRGTIIGLTALALTPAGVAAAATTSHAINFTNAKETVECGIVAKIKGTSFDPGVNAPLNGLWPGLQCGAAGIDPSHHGDGDPFVQLGQGATGRAKLVFLGDDDYASSSTPVKLKAGTTWSRDGITCSVAATSVTCKNSSGHGFTIKTGHLSTH